ncbi:hypothetical protein [Candidatus Karelsulcia muelleri]|nr:hypothetical protein [Candidatus Karelsulcia muelleri]
MFLNLIAKSIRTIINNNFFFGVKDYDVKILSTNKGKLKTSNSFSKKF